MSTRLGLDLGTNSIGWVLYRLGQDGEPEALIDGGVLIHSDGRKPQNQASNASERRLKRGMRRRRDRELLRRRRVARLLHEFGLLPDSEADRKAWRDLDPLQLRAQALDQALTPHELGRTLLSFTGRRGFKSNRKTDGGEDGEIRQDTKKLCRRIQQSGARTLGEYLWRRHSKGKTVRARLGEGLYPDRQMVQDELEAIRKAQRPFHTSLSNENWCNVINALLYQRNLHPVERGRCTLMPNEERAFKAYPLFQRYRIWLEVLNIEVRVPGHNWRPLSEAERTCLVTKLIHTKKQSFERILRLLSLPESTRINLNTTARGKLDGDHTSSVLRSKKCFGAIWDGLSLDQQQEVVELLLEEEYHAKVDWLVDEYDLTEDNAEAIASVKLPPGTSHLSKAAIERLLPPMECGYRYPDAVKCAGFDSHSDFRGGGDLDTLPYYGKVLSRHVYGRRTNGRSESEMYGRVANPTVHIALGQVRRLFNAIVEQYGKPDEAVVELARELKQSKLSRDAESTRQKQNKQRNDRLREMAEKAGHTELSKSDLDKLRLWDEQGKLPERVCPYSGKPLSIGLVLSNDTEVDHILPWSRTLDNRMNNKVVVCREANREKAGRTPFEVWGHDRDRYAAILARAELLPDEKGWRFEEDAMERFEAQRGFLERQLTETSYISRLVREYLEQAIDPRCVRVTPGRMTGLLRHSWGLNDTGNMSKNRNDHRHHMIDAAVIGMTSQSLLQRVSTAAGRDEHWDDLTSYINEPWDGFRKEVVALVDRCVVRHRPDHFTIARDKRARKASGQDVTSGSLHNDTAYGVVDGPDEKGNMTLVVRKNLADLNLDKPDDVRVRDRALGEDLVQLWSHVQASRRDLKAPALKQYFAEQAWQKLRVRRVRVLEKFNESGLAFIRDTTGNLYKAYRTDGNAYMDVWLLPDGKVTGETVTRYSANQPNHQSRIKLQHPTARKLMRLHINDMIAVGSGVDRRILRIQQLSGQLIISVDHNEAGDIRKRDREGDYTPLRKTASRVLEDGIRRVSVDVLGRVQDGGPFTLPEQPVRPI